MKFLFPFLITAFFAQILPAQDSDFLLDERDGNIYLVIQFNDQWWMCQNLKFDAGEGSSCYEGDETNCMLKGRWYSWEAAQRACPEGYRLPGDEDWKALEIFIGRFDADFAGIVNPISDDAYFNTHAYFWTATEHDEINGWARVMEKTKVGIDRQIITKNYGLSVRCVKDAVAESPD
jgi:hypothetical protein